MSATTLYASTTLAGHHEELYVHFLLIGPSKVGKTDYVADMIKDGFTVIYIDADQGLPTLRKRLAADPEAMARTHYVRTRSPFEFCMNLFFPNKAVFRWNVTKDINSAGGADTDEILIIDLKNLPKGIVFVVDSWTSTSFDLLEDSAKRNGISFETFNEGGQAAYGDANRRATQLCSYMRDFQGHILVQGHPGQYEQKEKPKGVFSGKEKDMVIVGNYMVPESCSKPHGYGMPKYFNEVGWMEINAVGEFTIDFKQKPNRVGGGTPNAVGSPKKDYRFSKAFIEPVRVEPGDWIRKVTVAELKAEQPVKAAPTPAATESATTATALPGKTANLGLTTAQKLAAMKNK